MLPILNLSGHVLEFLPHVIWTYVIVTEMLPILNATSCSALHLNSNSSRMLSGSLDVLYVVVWRPLADSLSDMHISVPACLQSFTVKKQRTKMLDFIVCIGI